MWKWLLHSVTQAYYDARKNKRNTVNQSRFERHLAANIIKLAKDIFHGKYKVAASIAFIIENTVKREVFAATFRDRIVHHLLYNWLMPIFEPLFIFDSYSCRKGKGTDFGAERLRKHIRQVSQSYTRPCWILKLDLTGYFISINRQKLYDIIIRTIQREGADRKPEWPIIDYLLRKVIFNDPTKGCRFRCSRSLWDGLPKTKSLFFALFKCGLPIGNLTSQLFSNVFLNELDQFVKRVLKVKHYGRYVDDSYYVAATKEELLTLIEPIRTFLKQELGLTLHPNKIFLQRAEDGVTFLGKFIKDDKIVPSKRCRRKARNHMAEVEVYERNPYKVKAVSAAYGGLV